MVIGGDEDVQTVLLDGGEVFGGVDAALEEDGVDGVFEEFGDELRGTYSQVSGLRSWGCFEDGYGPLRESLWTLSSDLLALFLVLGLVDIV